MVDPDLRARLSDAAVAAARAVGYVDAGTVEFVCVDGPDGGAYFLEMNTRLQVEHPVTEAVTGLDLVRLQLLIAGGAPLPAEVHEAVARGPWATPSRPASTPRTRPPGACPSTGDAPPRSRSRRRPGVRVDTGVAAGGAVSPHYDPMLAKVIAHAPTRPRRRPRWPPPWPAPGSTGSPPTATCWSAPSATRRSWPAPPTPASSTATA